jgi:SAM-dependent methyltransferase
VLLVLLAPSSNRVYAGEADRLAAAELTVMLRAAGLEAEVSSAPIAGVDYLHVTSTATDPTLDAEAVVREVTARGSATWAVFAPVGDLLRPIPLERPDLFEDDLVTIPKYPGKTNEQFTRMLVNLAVACRGRLGPLDILDPLAGRGTTLSTAWILGHDAYGVEADAKAVQAYGAFLRTYLRRKRLKHTVSESPVRREGRSLGHRLDATVRPLNGGEERRLTVFTGDTRDSRRLFGKRRFDAVVADAPYGVVHGSRTDVRGLERNRERTPAALLAEALPVWVEQLVPGGVLVLSWNTLGLRREALIELLAKSGLTAYDDEAPFRSFSHRVDASIQRDVVVARRL